jgi:hypothetical protein
MNAGLRFTALSEIPKPIDVPAVAENSDVRDTLG